MYVNYIGGATMGSIDGYVFIYIYIYISHVISMYFFFGGGGIMLGKVF